MDEAKRVKTKEKTKHLTNLSAIHVFDRNLADEKINVVSDRYRRHKHRIFSNCSNKI